MIELAILAIAAALWAAGQASKARAQARAAELSEAGIRQVTAATQLGLLRLGRFEEAVAFPAKLRAAIAMKQAQDAALSRGKKRS